MNRLFIYGLTFLIFGSASGQENDLYDHGLDDKKWEEIRRNIRYENRPENDAGREWTYENRQDYQRAQRNRNGGGGGNGNRGGNGTGRSDGGPNDGGSYRQEDYDGAEYVEPPSSDVSVSTMNGLGWLGYVLIAILIAAVAFLIYYLFVNRQKDGAKVVEINLEEQAPIDIPLTELQRLLLDALARKDYRGAVRIYFIFIIRDLSEKNWIQWQKEKTNYHYLREMSDRPVYDSFSKSVGYFEIIWYGKREIDLVTFEKIKPDFTVLLDKLGVK